MECPNCHHQSQPKVLITCSNCGHAYERALIEEYEHVRFLLGWLEQHRAQVGRNTETLLAELNSHKASLRAQMHIIDAKPPVIPAQALATPKPVVPVAPVQATLAPAAVPVKETPTLADRLETPVKTSPAVPAPASITAPTPKPVEMPPTPKPVPAVQPAPAMPASVTTPAVTSRPVAATMPALRPAIVSVPAPKPVTAPPPKPAAPPKPPINWGKVWDTTLNFMTSGAWLRALLYLGAFMFVISAGVLVISNWKTIPLLFQVVLMAAFPTFFYGGGWFIRARLKQQQNGIVVTGVGAILLAVDFAAVYQFINLNLDINLYWLIASLITTSVYIFTAFRLKGEFFGYLSLLAGISVFVSLTRVLNASMEWTIAVIPLTGALMTGLAGSLWPRGEAWRDIARPARYLPQVLTPLALFVIPFAGGPGSDAGKMTAFLCAVAAYGLLAWKFPSVWQLVLSLVSLMVTVLYGVRLFDTSNLWLPTAGSILAAGYILTGWRFFTKENARRDYRLAFYIAGFVLSLAVFVAALVLLVTGKRLEVVIPITILALSFCLWNLLLRHPLHGTLGGALLVFAFWLWLDIAHVQFDFYPLAYLLLISFVYLPISILMERVEKNLAEPFKWFGWLGSAAIFASAITTYSAQPAWTPALTLTLLSIYYAFSAWYFAASTFAWATALVLPLAVMQWTWFWKLPDEQSALVWPVLAFGYMLAERFLVRLKDNAWAKPAFRLPLGLGVIVLALAGLITSLVAYTQLSNDPGRVSLILTAQALVILLSILAARMYRSQWPLYFEPALAALLAVLFFYTYSSSLLGRTLEWYQYSLVLIGVAWLHLLVAAGLDPMKTRYAHGLYLGGYGLALLAIFWGLVDQTSLLWCLGAFILAMIFSAVLVEAKRHHTWNEVTGLFGARETVASKLVRAAFLWMAAWLSPIWCVLLLAHLNVPVEYRWLAISLPALLYLALGQILARREASYAWPFFSAAHVYTLISLLFNLNAFLNASNHIISGLFNPLSYTDGLQTFISQGFVQLAALLFYTAWAWMKSQRFFAHAAAWLSILPFTALLIVSQIFTPGQIVLAWAGWAGILLLAGFLLDRTPKTFPRFAHGPYLAGYALASGVVLVSLQARWLNINVLAIYLLYAILSAVAVHFNHHRTWDEFSGMFGPAKSTFVRVVSGGFLWVAAWLFPLWCVQILINLDVLYTFRFLALSLPALIYLALGQQLSKREATYAWPFFSAAHVYSLIALIFSAGNLLAASSQVIAGLSNPPGGLVYQQIFMGQGFVQLSVVAFYAAWAWMKRQSIFSLVSATLSILPFTALLLVLQILTPQGIVIAWSAWAGLLLLAGFVLDNPQGLPQGSQRSSPRYAHGPYLAGYVFASVFLVASLQMLWLNIIVMGMFLSYALISSITVHYHHHRTWDDFAGIFGSPETTLVRVIRGTFLWVTAWLFPLWCAQILLQLNIEYAFRWLALSVPALLYLLIGRQLSKREPTYAWPFFSAAHVYIPVAFFFSCRNLLDAGGQIIQGLSAPVITPHSLLIFMGQGLVGLFTTLFYATWAGMKGQRISEAYAVQFAHLSAWLSILPFTALLLCLQLFTAMQIVIAWGAWAGILMLAGFLLDNPPGSPQGFPRYAHGPYLAGYLMALVCLVTAFQDQWLTIVLLGMCILFTALSSVAMNFQRHQSWEDFINFSTQWWRKDSLVRRGARLLFLFFAVYALPVWIVLLEKYYPPGFTYALQGVSLALLAPLLIAGGLYLRRYNPDYTWPFYSAGYTLTALGVMLAADDQRLAIYVLILDIVVYAASSVIFRQTFWLYLATCLTPITALVILNYNSLLTNPAIAWTFMGITYLYFAAGQFLDRQQAKSASVAAYAMPFYFPAFILSAVSLAIAAGDSHAVVALGIFPLGVLLYGFSAWRFREPLFAYPAAWLSIVPYYLVVTMYTALPSIWYGLAWLPLILTFISLGRFVSLGRAPFDITSPRAIFHSLNQTSAPFYLIAYALSLTMVFTSQNNSLTFTLACAAAMLLYLGSALLFRHPGWIYPTLLSAHLTLLAYFAMSPSDAPLRMISVPFMILTFIEALIGYFISRFYKVAEMSASGRLIFKFFGKEVDFGSFPSLGFLSVPSWAQPIFIVVVIDTIGWESLALSSLDTGIWVSTGFFLLFTLLATLWQDSLLAYLALGLGSLAFSLQLQSMGYNTLYTFTGLGGLGLGLYLYSWLADWLKGALSVWRRPLANASIALSVLGLVVTLPMVANESIPAALALGFSGALYVTMSLRQRTYLLGYLGMGLLLAGWSLLLFKQNVSEPQFYAIPAGLYFAGMGFFERSRHPGRFALIIESLGLAILLVTAFTQSAVNGERGFIYFVLLLAEGLLVIWWGAIQHLRVPYIIGLISVVMNVLTQTVVFINTHPIDRLVIILGVGFIIMSFAVFGTWKRDQMLARGQEFRSMLEKWN